MKTPENVQVSSSMKSKTEKNNRVKRALRGGAFLLCILLGFWISGSDITHAVSAAEENASDKNAPVIAGEMISEGWTNEEREGSQDSEGDKFPAYYNSRENGITPEIRSQGAANTCWALTAASALEAALQPQEEVVFSADHIVYRNDFTTSVEDGGDPHMLMAYLSGWQGPVLEADDPYGDGESNADAPVAAHVMEMQLLEGENRDAFKEMVLQCGAVQTSLFMDRKLTSDEQNYYRADTYSYYYPEKRKITHDVLLIGWDDMYPKENFKITPAQDGAWICQNTWGEDFGDAGIFYVSYDDPNIAGTGLAYTKVEGSTDTECIYQLDTCGWQGRLGYEQPDCFFANVYTAAGDEQLQAVGFYSVGRETSYEVYIVHNFADETSLMHREYLAGGKITGKGYFTVPLTYRAEPLRAGERFAVIVNIHTEGEEKPAAVELKKDRYTQNVVTEGKESYLSLYGGTWENTQEKYQANICLKAYTTGTSR